MIETHLPQEVLSGKQEELSGISLTLKAPDCPTLQVPLRSLLAEMGYGKLAAKQLYKLQLAAPKTCSRDVAKMLRPF